MAVREKERRVNLNGERGVDLYGGKGKRVDPFEE